MRPGIKLKVKREPDDDGLYQFEIKVSNEQTCSALNFWGYADNFKEFGERLARFPKEIQDKVTYDLGGEDVGEIKWAYFLQLEAFCYNPSGHSALKIIIDNRFDIPDYEYSEFFIKSEPSSLNRLGQGLRNWNPLEIKEFEWVSNE